MDANSVRALTLAQLPEKYEPLLLSFYRGESPRPTGHLVAIGDDYGTTLYCDLGDGHVLSVDDEGRLPTRFVNSGITQLAQCLAEYERALRESQDPSTEPDVPQAARSLRSRLVQIDAPALADPEHWWSVIVEQVEAGLL